MVQFLGAWLLEGPDITALRIHARHYVADHAILARRVHALQNEHYGPFILSPQLLLQHAQELRAAFQKIVRSFLGMNVADVGGIPIVETKLLVFGDAVRFGDAESFFGEFVGVHGVARSVVRKCGDEEGLEHRQTKKRPWEGINLPGPFPWAIDHNRSTALGALPLVASRRRGRRARTDPSGSAPSAVERL